MYIPGRRETREERVKISFHSLFFIIRKSEYKFTRVEQTRRRRENTKRLDGQEN